MSRYMTALPGVVKDKLEEIKAIYLSMVENGVTPLPGTFISNGRIIECAIALLVWVEKKIVEAPNNITNNLFKVALKEFVFESQIPLPGRKESTYASTLNSIGVQRMHIVVQKLASEGILDPTNEQLAIKVKQMRKEGKLKSDRTTKADNDKRIEELRRDPTLKRLDEETQKWKTGNTPQEKEEMLKEFLSGD